jgi:cytochrome P450
MAAIAAAPQTAPLYPPRVRPPIAPRRFPFYLYDVVRNPISAWPPAVFEEPMLLADGPMGRLAWVMHPTFVKEVLLDKREVFRKTLLEKRVLGPLLGNGVFTSEGADWKWQRQVVAPLFRHGGLQQCVPAMVAAAEEMVARWQAEPGLRGIDRDMAAVTFRIISDTMLPGGDTFVSRAIENAHTDYLMPISWEVAYGMIGMPAWMPHPGTRSMRRAEREMRAAVAALISARRRNPLPRDDLFSRLIAARHPDTGEAMPDESLIDNLLTFLAAGHATTAMALTWTLYLLARSPDWEARLVEEIGGVAGKARIEAAHLDRLVLVEQVLKEAMRLYPPAPIMMREAREDTAIGEAAIPKGTRVIVPIYAIHRHRKLWSDADRFDPSRFSAAAEDERTRYQFMPFGAGPRICIGMSFAMLEAKAVLATFLRSCRFGHVAGCDPEPISRLTLRPHGGMRLRVSGREARPDPTGTA